MSARGSAGRVVTWLAAAIAVGLSPGAVRGQAGTEERPRYEVGLSAGVFEDYPSEFAEPYCEQKVGGVAAHASYWPRRMLGVEGAIVGAGGYGTMYCNIALLAPVPLGEPFDRLVYDEDTFGAGLFATQVAVVVEPAHGKEVSPRARAGVGRMWNKGLSDWFLGGGFRFQFGPHALVMDVEWWNFSIDVRQERVVYTAVDGLQILDSTDLSQTESPFLIRVGWAMDLGR